MPLRYTIWPKKYCIFRLRVFWDPSKRKNTQVGPPYCDFLTCFYRWHYHLLLSSTLAPHYATWTNHDIQSCIYNTSVFCWWLLIESNKMLIKILYNELLPSPLFYAFDLAWTYVPYCSRLFILKVLFLSPHSPHSIFHFNFQKTGKAASTETYARLVIKPYIIALQLVVII